MSRPFRFTASPALPVLDCLGQGTSAASLLATAQRLLALEASLQRQLPPGLASTCRVAGIDAQGMLTVAVPSAAHASRLRQILGRTQAALTADGWALNGIRPRIIAGLNTEPPPPLREALPLDDQALQAFSALHATLRAGPLADAVGRLLARRGLSDTGGTT